MKRVNTTPAYRIGLVLAAILMALPALLGRFIYHADRADFERRVLALAPEAADAVTEPRAYFQALNGFLDDHTAFAMTAKRWNSLLQYYVFVDSPSDLLHIGSEGEIFVHTFNPETPYSAAGICRPAAQRRAPDQILENLAALNEISAGYGAETRLMVAPSKITLYGDRFTQRAPQTVRDLCSAVSDGPDMRRLNEVDTPVISYPFDALRAERERPEFYPSRNFHWHGESIHVAMLDWIERQPESALRALDGAFQPASIRNDIPHLRGFEMYYEGRDYPYAAHGVEYSEAVERLPDLALLRRVRSQYAEAAAPVFDQRVLLLSNSFGIEGHHHVAPLYREMLWINLNTLPNQRTGEFFEQVMGDYQPDLVILLFHDHAVTGRVRGFLGQIR